VASKKHQPEEAVAKLWQVDLLVPQGQSVTEAIRPIGAREPRVLRQLLVAIAAVEGGKECPAWDNRRGIPLDLDAAALAKKRPRPGMMPRRPAGNRPCCAPAQGAHAAAAA
jgi:hypothetical protein